MLTLLCVIFCGLNSILRLYIGFTHHHWSDFALAAVWFAAFVIWLVRYWKQKRNEKGEH